MIERIRQRYGGSAQVLSVQEYFATRWVPYNSVLPIQEQIDECKNIGAFMISFHATIEVEDEETGKTNTVNIYPDVAV